jgi:hypothetical protein
MLLVPRALICPREATGALNRGLLGGVPYRMAAPYRVSPSALSRHTSHIDRQRQVCETEPDLHPQAPLRYGPAVGRNMQSRPWLAPKPLRHGAAPLRHNLRYQACLLEQPKRQLPPKTANSASRSPNPRAAAAAFRFFATLRMMML